MKKVLIIDDDTDNLTVVSDMLRPHFQPLVAAGGKQGIQMAAQTQPDVILLDINMPQMDGYEVCKRLKEQPSTRDIPVIMLTTESSLDSRVQGLDTGADDYLTKPFQIRELVARVNARVRRKTHETRGEADLAVGNLVMKPKSMEVIIGGQGVTLTQLEFDLLRYFLERPDEVIPRNKILGDLWPDSVVTDRTVDTHVANLRKKIKDFSCPLSTIYGAGYMLKTKP